ncbi:uncharacterized protein LOC135486286 [Lineus longissimus]|uniref:uncharacterized protein LOC135486286 n=1 Tax=Lineus longissimus TaxID=88925 RepID=UPI00315D0ABC
MSEKQKTNELKMVPGRSTATYFFFNLLISICSYVLEIFTYVMALIFIYQLEGESDWLWTIGLLTAFPIFATQVLSLYWALWRTDICTRKYGCFALIFYVIIHVFQLGVVFRFARLVVCNDVMEADDGMAEATLLRLFHAFCGGLPSLFITSYMAVMNSTFRDWQIILVIATALWSNSWALASFRRQGQTLLDFNSVRKAIPGALIKTLWRIGELSCRVMALVLFAAAYGYWVFLVLSLHWTVMFIWLFVLDVMDRKGKRSKRQPIRSLLLSAATAFIHILCFLNLQTTQPRYKVLCFYLVTFSECVMLFVAWVLNDGYNSNLFWFSMIIIASGIALALVSMIIYHKYFHLAAQIPKNSPGNQLPDPQGCINCKLSICVKHDTTAQRPFNVRFAEAYLKRRGSYPLLSEPGKNNTNTYVEFDNALQRRLSERMVSRVSITIKGDNTDQNNQQCVTNRSFRNIKEEKTTDICISSDSIGTIPGLQDHQRHLSGNNSFSDRPAAAISFSKGQNPFAYGANPAENDLGSRPIGLLVANNSIPVEDGETPNELSGDHLDSDGVSEGYVVREFSKFAGAGPDNVLRKERRVLSPRVAATSTIKSYKSKEKDAPLGAGIDNESFDCKIPSLDLSEGTDYPIYGYLANRELDVSESEPSANECDTIFTNRSSEEELSHYVKNFSFMAFSQSPETISRLRVSSADSGVGDSRVQSNLVTPRSASRAAEQDEGNMNTICSESGRRRLRAAGARSRQSILSLGLSFRSIYDSLSLDHPQPLVTTSCVSSSNQHLHDSLTMVTSLSTVDVTCASTPSGHHSQCTCANNSIFGESSFDRTEYSTILASADQSGQLDYFGGFSKRNTLDTGDHWYECINADTDISHVIPSDSESPIYENPGFLLSNHEISAYEKV